MFPYISRPNYKQENYSVCEHCQKPKSKALHWVVELDGTQKSKNKRKELENKYKNLCWWIVRNFSQSTYNTILLYMSILYCIFCVRPKLVWLDVWYPGLALQVRTVLIVVYIVFSLWISEYDRRCLLVNWEQSKFHRNLEVELVNNEKIQGTTKHYFTIETLNLFDWKTTRTWFED